MPNQGWTTNQPFTEVDDGEQSGNWTIFKMNLPLSAIFCSSGSSLQCIHSSCDTIHLSVMWENEHMFKSSQKLSQGDPVKHCPFHHCISGQVSSFHHIEFESLSIIFIILFSSSCFKCLALWSSAPINKSAPIIQSITWRKAENPYLADYFLYKWHQTYNFSWLPTYPLVNTRKRHMTIFLVDIPVKLQSG